MKITREEFESYWESQGKYRSMNNAGSKFSHLADKIEELKDSVELDEYICNLKAGKEVNRNIVVDFYNYLGKGNPKNKPESNLYDAVFYDNAFERQLEIAKFLHTPKTPTEIQEKFHINDRTMRKDLQELEEGIKVLGTTIRITKEKKGRKYYYKSTLHPIFLPLNLSEVYAMTVYLDNTISKNDLNAEIIRSISERIKSQLSDYAYDRLFGSKTDRFKNNHDFNCYHRSGNYYIDDERLAHQRRGIVMYLMKSGQTCRFLWENQEYTGKIVYANGGYRIKVIDETSDASSCNEQFIDAPIEEVDFIIESLDYV